MTIEEAFYDLSNLEPLKGGFSDIGNISMKILKHLKKCFIQNGQTKGWKTAPALWQGWDISSLQILS